MHDRIRHSAGVVAPEAPRRRRRLLRFGASVAGAAIVSVLGWALAMASLELGAERMGEKAPLHSVFDSFAQSLARLSFDLQFVFRGSVPPPEGCIVYLDENSAGVLGQSTGPWDRRLHAQLVRKLTADGARAVLFDLIFSEPSAEPGVDEEFAAAIAENGRVHLGAALELDGGAWAYQERTIPPIALLRRAAAGWGLIAFRPIDTDYTVRRIYAGMETVPSASWRAAMKLGARGLDTPESRAVPRWMNYYGPPDSFPNISYDRALAADGVAPGFFRDRIVCIGGRSTLGDLTLGKDDFRNPYSRINRSFTTGVEVHLTALLNLVHGHWLTRLDPRWELGIALVAGLLLGGALPLLRPHAAACVAGLAAVAAGVIACWMFVQERTWFAWCIPAFVEAPLALGWAVGARYFIEERRRRALRQAFGHYLSTAMADRIADAEFDLTPGGVVVEATVMITDLEGFTPLSEQLHEPDLISNVLMRYFSQTTGHILERDGTIINFVGDAVTAVWGAPLAEREHARKAGLAACRLRELSQIEVEGRVLRTRIGLHTGRVLAGNVGSAERFDYAVVGDAVNFASRLEGLNKYFGTTVLISDECRRQLGDGFITRCLGEIRVVGKAESRIVHELLGLKGKDGDGPWLDNFSRGLAAFRRGDFAEGEREMRETIARRGGTDGPATFYLAEIARARTRDLPADWTGVLEFTAK